MLGESHTQDVQTIHSEQLYRVCNGAVRLTLSIQGTLDGSRPVLTVGIMARCSYVDFALQEFVLLHLCLADSLEVASGMADTIHGLVCVARGQNTGVQNIVAFFECSTVKQWQAWGEKIDFVTKPLIE
jgi:hypothetical protein